MLAEASPREKAVTPTMEGERCPLGRAPTESRHLAESVGRDTPASYSVLKAAFLAARLAASSSRDTASIAASAAAVAASSPPKRLPAETNHLITAGPHSAMVYSPNYTTCLHIKSSLPLCSKRPGRRTQVNTRSYHPIGEQAPYPSPHPQSLQTPRSRHRLLQHRWQPSAALQPPNRLTQQHFKLLICLSPACTQAPCNLQVLMPHEACYCLREEIPDAIHMNRVGKDWSHAVECCYIYLTLDHHSQGQCGSQTAGSAPVTKRSRKRSAAPGSPQAARCTASKASRTVSVASGSSASPAAPALLLRCRGLNSSSSLSLPPASPPRWPPPDADAPCPCTAQQIPLPHATQLLDGCQHAHS